MAPWSFAAIRRELSLGQAEANVVVPVGRLVPVPVSGPQPPGVVVPRTTAQHTVLARLRAPPIAFYHTGAQDFFNCNFRH